MIKTIKDIKTNGIQLDVIYNCNCIDIMKEIPDEMIHLIITSPPYNVGMKYGVVSDRREYNEYLDFAYKWLSDCYRILIAGGRIVINLPSCIMQSTKSRSAYMLLDYIDIMKKIGYLPREMITWIKMPRGGILGQSTSWGSWRSPSCPYLRDGSEFIIIMDKKQHKRTDKKGQNDITKKEFMNFTTNVWYMTPESSRRHPAPFPAELPYRAIKLYSWENDIVLDPFAGSGTTLITAKRLNRRFIGIEINFDFCKLIDERLRKDYIQMQLF